MQFVDFPESNRALHAPEGMEATVGTLHVYNDGNQSVSCWMPSDEERKAIAAGGPVWLGVLDGPTQPPVWLCGLKPYMPPIVQYKADESMLRALEFIAKLLPDPATLQAGLREGADLASEQPELRTPDGQPLDPAERYYVGGPAVATGHYAALVEAYQLYGQAGVVEYLQPYESFLPKEVFAQPAQ